MVSTAVAYTILTLVLIGVLATTVIAGNELSIAQNVPATYLELGSLAYSVSEQMVASYRAAVSTRSTVTASIYVPTTILGAKYSLTINSNSVIAVSGNIKRVISLPALNDPAAVWGGQFNSGGSLVHIVATYSGATNTVTVTIKA